MTAAKKQRNGFPRFAQTICALLVFCHGALATAAEADASKPSAAGPPRLGERFGFATEVLPILTKSGCNTGACHGAAVGQGGFRLSLLGYDPEADYENITRELGGRRIELAAPEESLFLRKPTREFDHEGGRRIKRGSDDYAALAAWIRAGAPYGRRDLSVERIETSPKDVLLSRPGETAAIKVQALLSDGVWQDVTARALYTSNDDAIATVDATGEVTVLARGVTTIMVRYSGQAAAARVGVPFQDVPLANIDFPPQNFIDRHILGELTRLRLPPSALSSDAEFFRRVHLDALGKLPAENDVLALAGSAPGAGIGTAEARRQLIDKLLEDESFVDFWTLKFADLLLIHSKRLGEPAARAYHGWLREQIARNTPVNQWVRQLLTSEGDASIVGPANFHRLKQDPRDAADYVSQSLLGVRVACARCHNHPTDRWTQEDYHRFAAFFARTGVEEGRVFTSERGEVLHPKTQREMAPKPLGGTFGPAPNPEDRRAALANWMTSPENPMLAQAFVNRVWKELLGRGLVEPVDDLRPTNPPTHPALFEELTQAFIRQGFDLRWLIRAIVSSRTYQLSARANDRNKRDDRYFSRAYLKPLTAQVLSDAIAQAAGAPDVYPGWPAGTRAVQLLDPLTPSYALDVFGRCQRETLCEPASAAGGGLSQALHMINGPAINSKLPEAIRTIANSSGGLEDWITSLYARTLSRTPASAELAHWSALITAAPSQEEALEDLLWALLNSKEFGYNH